MSHMPWFFPENKLVRIKTLLILFPGGIQVFLERGIAGVTRNKWKNKQTMGLDLCLGVWLSSSWPCVSLWIQLKQQESDLLLSIIEWCPTKGYHNGFIQFKRPEEVNKYIVRIFSEMHHPNIHLVGASLPSSLTVNLTGEAKLHHETKHLRWLMSHDQQNLTCSYLALACTKSSSSEWECAQDALRDPLKSNQTDRL